MKKKATEKWLKSRPQSIPKGATAPEELWLIELEALDKEKLIAILDPKTQKILDIEIKKIG